MLWTLFPCTYKVIRLYFLYTKGNSYHFTIEPMIDLGKKELVILADKWAAVTKDGSLSAQFEQTIYATPSGFEIPFDL